MFFKFNQVFTKLRESIEEQSSVISILKEKTDQVREAGACLDCFSCKVWASLDLVCFIPTQRVETAHSTEHIDEAGISRVTCYTSIASPPCKWYLTDNQYCVILDFGIYWTGKYIIKKKHLKSKKFFKYFCLVWFWSKICLIALSWRSGCSSHLSAVLKLNFSSPDFTFLLKVLDFK